MEGIKLGFSFVDMAKRWGTGIGSYRLNDGSSVKLLSNPKTGITQLFQVKYNRLISAEAAKGNDNILAMIGRYEQKAVNIEEADHALISSFQVIG